MKKALADVNEKLKVFASHESVKIAVFFFFKRGPQSYCSARCSLTGEKKRVQIKKLPRNNQLTIYLAWQKSKSGPPGTNSTSAGISGISTHNISTLDHAVFPNKVGSLSKDDGNSKDNTRKQCSDWLNKEK